MESKVAVISIIVSRSEDIPKLNRLLHSYADFIIGRMGIPYRSKGFSLISVAVDAPTEQIRGLTASLDGLEGIRATVSEAPV